MPNIFMLMRAKRQSCQGRKVLKNTVRRVGRVTYGEASLLLEGAGPVLVMVLYSGISGQPGRSLAL